MMRHYFINFIVFISVLGYCSNIMAAAVPTSEAGQHVGEKVSVVGLVKEVHISKGGTIFLDFDNNYPNEDFMAVIFKSYAHNFVDVNKHEGKMIVVEGDVKLYHGKPEIILKSQNQISQQ